MTFKNSVNYFPIHKTQFFVALMILLVFSLVMANNFFYYQSRDDLAQSTLRQVEQSLSGQYESCLKSNLGTNKCQEIFIKGLKKSWKVGIISVLDYQGKLVFESDKEPYKEDRSVMVHIGEAGSDEARLHFVLSKRSSPPLWKSSLRSMFLSFWEIPGQRDVSYFFWNIAFKRSSPLFYSLITISILLWLVRLADRKKKQYYERIEAENFIVSNDLVLTRENLKYQQIKESQLDEKIKSLKQNETELLQDYCRDIDELRASIKESQEREQNLLEKQTSMEKLLQKVKPSESGDAKSSLKELLLDNPEIKLHPVDFDINPGDHHSKKYVENIGLSLKKDPLSSRLITKVNAAKYEPTQNKVAILEWNGVKNIFVLNVCDVYVAEVVLRTNAAESAFIAKYLFSGKNFLAKKGFKLKIGTLT